MSSSSKRHHHLFNRRLTGRFHEPAPVAAPMPLGGATVVGATPAAAPMTFGGATTTPAAFSFPSTSASTSAAFFDRAAVQNRMESEFFTVKQIMESPQWIVLEEPTQSNHFVRISKMFAEGNNLAIFKGEGIVRDVPIEIVWKVLYDVSIRGMWDTAYISSRSVDVVSNDGLTDVVHVQFKSPVPVVSNRDFVLARTWREIPNSSPTLPPPHPASTVIPLSSTMRMSLSPAVDQYTSSLWIPNFSVEHPLAPPVSGFVRGKMITSGGILRPIFELSDDGITVREHTHIFYFLQVDPAGMIPAWVVNLVGKNQMTALDDVTRCSKHVYQQYKQQGIPPSSLLPLRYYNREAAIQVFRDQVEHQPSLLRNRTAVARSLAANI